jgi:hypothetical protein
MVDICNLIGYYLQRTWIGYGRRDLILIIFMMSVREHVNRKLSQNISKIILNYCPRLMRMDICHCTAY